jgi:hypothetical protein
MWVRLGRGDVAGEARGGVVQLGARRAADRFGYVDPLPLLGPADVPLGPAPAPRPARARTPPAPPVTSPAAAPSTVATPVLAWVGLGLLAAGLSLGEALRRRGTVGRCVGRMDGVRDAVTRVSSLRL